MLDVEVEVADPEAAVVVEAGLDHAEKPILDQALEDLVLGLEEVKRRTPIPNLLTLSNNMGTLGVLDHLTPNKIMDHLQESKTGIVLTF